MFVDVELVPFVLEVALEIQQSAVLLALAWKSLQLLKPHTRLPAHWESESQSPSFSWQGEEEEQHLQSVFSPVLVQVALVLVVFAVVA